MSIVRRLGLIALLGLALAPASAAAATLPPAGRLLLTRSDLGQGWTVAGVAPTPVPPLTCHALPARLRRVASRRAASPTFSGSDATSGAPELVQETAARYASTTAAGEVWGAVAQPSLLGCLAASLRRGAGQGVKFTVTGRRVIRAPRLPVHARAYRVTAMAHYQGQAFPAYLDELVLNLPGVVAELSVATYESPPTAAFEARVGRIAVRRGSSPR